MSMVATTETVTGGDVTGGNVTGGAATADLADDWPAELERLADEMDSWPNEFAQRDDADSGPGDEADGDADRDADGDGRVVGCQAPFAPPSAAEVAAVRDQLERDRQSLDQAAGLIASDLAGFARLWWASAVEDVVVFDPDRTIAVADRLSGLKIELMQLQAQAGELASLIIRPALPSTDDEITNFRTLLRGNQPSKVIEDPVRVLLGAIASPLVRAGLIDAGGNRDFAVASNVWRYRFGVDMAPLHERLAAYDCQVEAFRDLRTKLESFEKALTRAHARSLWQGA